MNPKGSVVRGNRAVQIRAMRLHRDGYPIRHIRRVTDVAKSTISEWIRNAGSNSAWKGNSDLLRLWQNGASRIWPALVMPRAYGRGRGAMGSGRE